MKIPHLAWLGSVCLAPGWYQRQYRERYPYQLAPTFSVVNANSNGVANVLFIIRTFLAPPSEIVEPVELTNLEKYPAISSEKIP